MSLLKVRPRRSQVCELNLHPSGQNGAEPELNLAERAQEAWFWL
jgi:hypothetical protein